MCKKWIEEHYHLLIASFIVQYSWLSKPVILKKKEEEGVILSHIWITDWIIEAWQQLFIEWIRKEEKKGEGGVIMSLLIFNRHSSNIS